MWYSILNIFFFVFHTAFTLFNITGWALRSTRRWHLITMLLTAASWFILGIWYGWGYCVCTDWHWQVRSAMGIHDYSNSYIHFLILKLTGHNLNTTLVEQATLYIFLLCFILTIWFNYRGKTKKTKV